MKEIEGSCSFVEDLSELRLVEEGARLRARLSGSENVEDLRNVLRLYFAALELQSQDVLLLGDDRSVMHPFLLRAVERKGAGPIRVLFNGKWEICDTVGCSYLLGGPGVMLIPGMVISSNPEEAVLLGRFMSPKETLVWFNSNGERFKEAYHSFVPWIRRTRNAVEPRTHVRKR